MKSRSVIGLLLLAVMSLASSVHAATTGNINGYLGEKFLKSSDWSADGGPDLKNQFELGVLFDIRPTEWPINIAVDLLASSTEDKVDGYKFEGRTSEFAFGVRKYFGEQGKGKVQPYVGGGLASVSAEQKVKVNGVNISVDDNGLGVWFSGGIKFMPTDHLNLGADLRFSRAKLQFGDEDVQAGGVHFGIFAGYGF